jgi:putative aldouronate transport system substrate-binding protein
MLRVARSVCALLLLFAGAQGAFAGAQSEGGAAAAAGPVKLSLWCDLGKAAGAVKTLDDNITYQKIQEKLGIDIEFLHPPVGSTTEQFNLLVASRQFPDMIQYEWLRVPGGPGAYIKDKVIIPLNDPINKWAPNLQKTLQKYPLLKKQFQMDDGTYYVFPAFYGDPDLAHHTGPIIRNDWWPKLGIKEYPTTIDEWTAMLRAAKGKDLNGNGTIDEIPLHLQGIGVIKGAPAFLGAWGLEYEFYNDKGRIKYGPLQPEFQEFVKLLNMWYREGLLDPEFAASSGKIQDAKYTGDRIFAYIGAMGAGVTRFTAIMKPKNPAFQMMPMSYPTLKKGERPIVGQATYMFNLGGVAITTAAKQVKEAATFLDYAYGDEGYILSNWGVQGLSWEFGPDGKRRYTELVRNNPEGLSREQAMAKYTIWQFTTAVAKFKDVLNERDSLPEQIEGRKSWMSCLNEIKLPPLTPTIEEAKEVAGIMSEIQTYTDENVVGMIMGKIPLSDYPKFIQGLKSMKIDRAIELTQAQLDRYDKRK